MLPEEVPHFVHLRRMLAIVRLASIVWLWFEMVPIICDTSKNHFAACFPAFPCFFHYSLAAQKFATAGALLSAPFTDKTKNKKLTETCLCRRSVGCQIELYIAPPVVPDEQKEVR